MIARHAQTIKSDRLLAVTTTKRSEALPDTPTVGDFLPGYEASTWFGVGVPKTTPAKIIEKLNKEVNATLADPKTMARLADFGSVPTAITPPTTARSPPLKSKNGPRW